MDNKDKKPKNLAAAIDQLADEELLDLIVPSVEETGSDEE